MLLLWQFYLLHTLSHLSQKISLPKASLLSRIYSDKLFPLKFSWKIASRRTLGKKDFPTQFCLSCAAYVVRNVNKILGWNRNNQFGRPKNTFYKDVKPTIFIMIKEVDLRNILFGLLSYFAIFLLITWVVNNLTTFNNAVNVQNFPNSLNSLSLSLSLYICIYIKCTKIFVYEWAFTVIFLEKTLHCLETSNAKITKVKFG